MLFYDSQWMATVTDNITVNGVKDDCEFAEASPNYIQLFRETNCVVAVAEMRVDVVAGM